MHSGATGLIPDDSKEEHTEASPSLTESGVFGGGGGGNCVNFFPK